MDQKSAFWGIFEVVGSRNYGGAGSLEMKSGVILYHFSFGKKIIQCSNGFCGRNVCE